MDEHEVTTRGLNVNLNADEDGVRVHEKMLLMMKKRISRKNYHGESGGTFLGVSKVDIPRTRNTEVKRRDEREYENTRREWRRAQYVDARHSLPRRENDQLIPWCTLSTYQRSFSWPYFGK